MKDKIATLLSQNLNFALRDMWTFKVGDQGAFSDMEENVFNWFSLSDHQTQAIIHLLQILLKAPHPPTPTPTLFLSFCFPLFPEDKRWRMRGLT